MILFSKTRFFPSSKTLGCIHWQNDHFFFTRNKRKVSTITTKMAVSWWKTPSQSKAVGWEELSAVKIPNSTCTSTKTVNDALYFVKAAWPLMFLLEIKSAFWSWTQYCPASNQQSNFLTPHSRGNYHPVSAIWKFIIRKSESSECCERVIISGAMATP